MRMIQTETNQTVRALHLYLSPKEARDLKSQLEHLLVDPEANEHFHLLSEDGRREISCSVLTEKKLVEGRYSDVERRAFGEK